MKAEIGRLKDEGGRHPSSFSLHPFLSDPRGYSSTLWAVFFGLVLVPLLALGIELGRYYYARAEVAKAADAAALAGAAEISRQIFIETGDLQPTEETWASAQAYAGLNSSYLAQYGIHVVVTGIVVDAEGDTLTIQVSANLDRLFPSVMPDVMVTETGVAQIRAFTR